MASDPPGRAATAPEVDAAEAHARRLYDLDRTTAFSDGVFAIAITLLVLTIEVPDLPAGQSDRLPQALENLSGQVGAFLFSFVVIGLFWVRHHRAFAVLREADGRLTVINLAYLAAIVFIPFSTEVMGKYGDEPVSVTLYAANLAIATLIAGAMAWHIGRAGLIDPEFAEEHRAAALFRTLGAAAVFLVSIPLAYSVSPAVARWFWLLALPIGILARRRAGARS